MGHDLHRPVTLPHRSAGQIGARCCRPSLVRAGPARRCAVARPGALERPHVRAELIRHLALRTRTQTQLGKLYGVTQQSVGEFATRHAAEIAEARGRLQDKADEEFAHLWAASKVNRIATLQDQVERVLDLMADPETLLNANVGLAETERVVQTALRGIAEELGQLPSRTTVQHEGGLSVRYEVVGLDPEVLK